EQNRVPVGDREYLCIASCDSQNLSLRAQTSFITSQALDTLPIHNLEHIASQRFLTQDLSPSAIASQPAARRGYICTIQLREDMGISEINSITFRASS